ncbi:hypothetical protein BP5796_00548 [Coleophoma crateriformis]|uniref:DUF8035 domain-containing protein n=1 Tax=Coleophoma crateriformis TaxID=565419 RepID=A0A3D8T8D5_9HELO|nr:hypothetical protein BP5796_00548 [Coleophoma crateriformis]
MSFGASPSDIIIVVTFCRALYRRCKEAGGEYLEISREVRGLHTVLRHLKYEVQAPESLLNRDRSLYGRDLAPIIGDCDNTLHGLDLLLQKYGRLGDGSPSSPRVLWEKMRFGSNELDELGGMRVKLISHKTSLTLFLDTIQLHESGKVATTLQNQGGQLDMILDKVDNIAARMGQRAGSIMTNYQDDDKEVWKQFRRELVAEGFDSGVLHRHKDVLRAYIREIDQKGLLDEMPIDPKSPSAQPGVNPDHWLDSVHSETSDEPPPSFHSLNTNSTDESMKELVRKEDNMKFLPSLKTARVHLEPEDGNARKNMNSPAQPREHKDRSYREPSPIPRVTTSSEKEPLYFNSSGSDSGNSERSEKQLQSLKASDMALVVRTSDLVASSPSINLQVTPSGSPSSYRSYNSFTGRDDPARSLPVRSKDVNEFGASPRRSGVLAVPTSYQPSKDGSNSPRQEPLRLAPDQNGNEIPPDAKWTKIKRTLVSPEVLVQDHRRYEAHPDFVAVLGVLTYEQIQDYAARSQALRDARYRRQQQPPSHLPQSMPIPISQPSSSRSREIPSDDESESSEEVERRRPRYQEHRSYPGSPSPNYTHTTRSGYPNPYGQPPSPSTSSSTLTVQVPRLSPHSPRDRYIPHSSSNKEAERQEPRRRHSSPPRRSHSSQKNADTREKPKSRWKENLGAGAVGGAAMSLLHVLAEAAEDL